MSVNVLNRPHPLSFMICLCEIGELVVRLFGVETESVEILGKVLE